MRSVLFAAISIVAALISFDATAAPQSASALTDPAVVAQEQRTRLAARLRIVDLLMRVVEPDLRTADNGVARRQWMLQSLYAMPLEKLQSIPPSPSFQALSAAIVDKSTSSPAALGSPSDDLVYKPIAPCRFVDTRVAGPGKLSGSRSFDISQSGNVYGGDVNCNLPTLAGASVVAIAAVAMNLTYFDTSTAVIPGFLGARPVGSTNLTSVLNWNVSNAFAQDANTTVVTMNQSGTTDEFEVFMSAGSVHVIIDMMGMFLAPQATALDCTTVVTNGAGSVPTGSTFPFPTPTVCPTGYTGVAIACEYGPTPPDGLALTSVGAADVTTGFLTCLWRNDSGGTLNGSDFHTHTRCCRVPGR